MARDGLPHAGDGLCHFRRRERGGCGGGRAAHRGDRRGKAAAGGNRGPGDPGGNRVPGNPGGDRVPGGPGGNRVPGGPGGNRVPGDPGGDRVPGDPGGDRVPGDPGGNRIPGGPGGNRGPTGPQRLRGDQRPERNEQPARGAGFRREVHAVQERRAGAPGRGPYRCQRQYVVPRHHAQHGRDGLHARLPAHRAERRGGAAQVGGDGREAAGGDGVPGHPGGNRVPGGNASAGDSGEDRVPGGNRSPAGRRGGDLPSLRDHRGAGEQRGHRAGGGAGRRSADDRQGDAHLEAHAAGADRLRDRRGRRRVVSGAQHVRGRFRLHPGVQGAPGQL